MHLSRKVREKFPGRQATLRFTLLLGTECTDPTRASSPLVQFPSKFTRSVLRHIRVTSKHELKERIMAGIDDLNRHPDIHTWSYKLADAF